MENLEKAEAVQRMQDHIHQHLHGVITLRDLSVCAGYSPFHCVRVFREMTGRTPFEYIRALRFSRAAMELRDEQARIIDALEFVFDSVGSPGPSQGNSASRPHGTGRIRSLSACSCPIRP